jgi:hypothetical protein
MAASLLLLVSAAVGLAGGGSGPPPAERRLLARGWQRADHVACGPLREGAYYEAANEEGSAELLALPEGAALVSRLPLPEPPYDCREITEPHFVEEIL